MISCRFLMLLLTVCCCCCAFSLVSGKVSRQDELRLLMESLTASKTAPAMRGTIIETAENNTLLSIDGIVFPNVATSSTQWFSSIAYSDARCTANRAIIHNSYVSGVCINYFYNVKKSVRFSCINGGDATVTYFNGYNCTDETGTSSYDTNTCFKSEDDTVSQKTYKYTCSVGADTAWYTNQVEWFVASGYSDSTCSNMVENVGVRNDYCFQKSLKSSTRYVFPRMIKYMLSSTCNSGGDGANTVVTYPTTCTANNANTVAYGNFYTVRKIASSIVKSDYVVTYTVRQTFSGITMNTYARYQSAIETVLANVIATVMNGVASSDVNFLLIEQPSSGLSSDVMVEYSIRIPSVKRAGYTSAADAYNQTTSQLLSSVYSGTFTNTLTIAAAQSNVTVLKNVQAIILPTVSDYSATKIQKRKKIPLTGIIVGVVVGVVVLIVATVTGFFKARNTTVKPKYGVMPNTSLENTQQQQHLQTHYQYVQSPSDAPRISPGINFV